MAIETVMILLSADVPGVRLEITKSLEDKSKLSTGLKVKLISCSDWYVKADIECLTARFSRRDVSIIVVVIITFEE